MNIRCAAASDAPRLLQIYAPYVENTAVTFEYETPSLEEFEKRIRATLKKYPYLVVEEEGRVLGYAYAGPFKARAAYDWAVETTIYLDEACRGMGYGRALYAALEDALHRQGFLNAYACIAFTEKVDEYLTNASKKFHEKVGYKLCGTFHQCGYKFGRWYDMIWMEKMLGQHGGNPEEIRKPDAKALLPE